MADSWVDVKNEYGVELIETKDVAFIITAVVHVEFKKMSLNDIVKLYIKLGDDEKGLPKDNDLRNNRYNYWRLYIGFYILNYISIKNWMFERNCKLKKS